MENKDINSLLEETKTTQSDQLSELKNTLLDNKDSLLDNNVSLIEEPKLNQTVDIDQETKERIEFEVRKRYFMNPENQANMLLNNYQRDHGSVSRRERRLLYREFLKRAKHGVYNKMFMEQAVGMTKDDAIEKIKNLNSPS